MKWTKGNKKPKVEGFEEELFLCVYTDELEPDEDGFYGAELVGICTFNGHIWRGQDACKKRVLWWMRIEPVPEN